MKLVVLQGLLSNASGGLAASVPAMVRALSEETYVRPHVLGISDANVPGAAVGWGSHVSEHRSYGPLGFHWAPTMARMLDDISPDVIDTQGIWMNLSRVALSRHNRYKTPLTVTPHGMLDPWAVQQSYNRKRLARWWYEDEHLSRAGAVRALNEDEAQAIRSFGVSSPIVIIPNGINMPDSERLIDFDNRAPVLQFLGRLDPKKGLEPLLHAWALVCADPSANDWRLRINGWGSPNYVKRLKRLVTELLIEETVLFGGAIYGEEKDQAIGSAAGFILPSFSEGLPMAVLEAWSWGTPVLMTRACNLPVGFSSNAALKISTEPKALARSIIDYMALSSEERSTMSLAGRRLVHAKYQYRMIAKDLERMYDWLAFGTPQPSDLMFDA